MPKNSVVIEEEPAPAIASDVLSKVTKENMNRAVVERFKGSADLAAATPKKRSPYWQPADDQC